MKIQNSRYFYYVIILMSLGVIISSVYYQLGGFREIRVEEAKGVNYSIAGVEFRGKYNDPEIERLFNAVRDEVATKRIKGILSLIDYLDEDLEPDEVRFFIGIILQERISELPPDYTVRKISAGEVVETVLDVHPMVRPRKDEIESRLYAAAQASGKELEDYFLEKHFEDNMVIVQGFVKN